VWNEDVDLPGKIEWFNTLVPLNIGKEWTETFTKAVEGVRATRGRIPGNGQPYSAYRCLHRGGKEAFREYAVMEIFFNYTGYQLLDRGSALLQQENLGASDDVADIGMDTGRPALLDVLVDVDDGCSKYTFLYHRYLKY